MNSSARALDVLWKVQPGHRIMELSRLEGTFKITESNH